MTKSDIGDLAETIQRLRVEEYSDLPASLIAKIIEAEARYIDDRVEASKSVARIIEDYLNEEG